MGRGGWGGAGPGHRQSSPAFSPEVLGATGKLQAGEELDRIYPLEPSWEAEWTLEGQLRGGSRHEGGTERAVSGQLLGAGHSGSCRGIKAAGGGGLGGLEREARGHQAAGLGDWAVSGGRGGRSMCGGPRPLSNPETALLGHEATRPAHGAGNTVDW